MLFDYGAVVVITAISTAVAYDERTFVLDGTGFFQQGSRVGELGDDTQRILAVSQVGRNTGQQCFRIVGCQAAGNGVFLVVGIDEKNADTGSLTGYTDLLTVDTDIIAGGNGIIGQAGCSIGNQADRCATILNG